VVLYSCWEIKPTNIIRGEYKMKDLTNEIMELVKKEEKALWEKYLAEKESLMLVKKCSPELITIYNESVEQANYNWSSVFTLQRKIEKLVELETGKELEEMEKENISDEEEEIDIIEKLIR
jgi:hypothetical protein